MRRRGEVAKLSGYLPRVQYPGAPDGYPPLPSPPPGIFRGDEARFAKIRRPVGRNSGVSPITRGRRRGVRTSRAIGRLPGIRSGNCGANRRPDAPTVRWALRPGGANARNATPRTEIRHRNPLNSDDSAAFRKSCLPGQLRSAPGGPRKNCRPRPRRPVCSSAHLTREAAAQPADTQRSPPLRGAIGRRPSFSRAIDRPISRGPRGPRRFAPHTPAGRRREGAAPIGTLPGRPRTGGVSHIAGIGPTCRIVCRPCEISASSLPASLFVPLEGRSIRGRLPDRPAGT